MNRDELNEKVLVEFEPIESILPTEGLMIEESELLLSQYSKVMTLVNESLELLSDSERGLYAMFLYHGESVMRATERKDSLYIDFPEGFYQMFQEVLSNDKKTK